MTIEIDIIIKSNILHMEIKGPLSKELWVILPLFMDSVHKCDNQ